MAEDLSSATLAFSLNLHRQLLAATSGSGKNVVFSPFSIATALSMTLAGARGRTAEEIAAVLHTGKLKDVHTNFSEFLAKISGLAPDVTLEVANRLYCEKTYSILEEYTGALKKFYGSGVEPANFKTEAEQARLAVNAWVEKTTKSKIKDLLPSGTVDYDTALVLVNAVYFKGLWQEPFNPRRTSQKHFHTSKDKTKNVDMMRREGEYRMCEKCDDLKASAIEIPYKGGKTSMLILLPYDVEGLTDLEAALTPSKVADVLKCLGSTKTVKLSLPRFKVEQAVNLKDTLSSMGVKELFAETADLSGIDGKQELSVSAAIHKAFVEVNEEGTEAAAATAMPAANSCEITPKFTVDHPFMFLIRSHNPDIVLFLGSVRDI
uniref:Putative serine proteinase inhibitor n=1 Tax=Amblyomma cajennense TaxID=34607 RepID=A0A023FKT4_AMBCJ